MKLEEITYQQMKTLLEKSSFKDVLDDYIRNEVEKRFRECIENKAKSDYEVFPARQNDHLINEVCWELGKEKGEVIWQYHADKTFTCEIKTNVRKKDCYVLLAVGDKPKEDIEKFTELVDALKRARAHEIIGVIPELPGQRQDKRHGRRQAISIAKYLKMFDVLGVDHIIAIEPHAPQIEALHKSFDPLSIAPIVTDYIKKTSSLSRKELEEQIVVVSPDAGGMRSAEFVAKHFNYKNPEYTFVKKSRIGVNESKTGEVIGDVKNKTVLIYDDIFDTGGTLIGAAKACRKAGARYIYASVAHCLANNKLDFNPQKDKDVTEKIAESEIDELIVTNSRIKMYKILTQSDSPNQDVIDKLKSKVTVLSIAKYLAQAIKRDRKGDTIR